MEAPVRCNACDDELVVGFSGKRRGICPWCTARRMAATAHLVDRVLPAASYRQWVLSVPKPLRLRLARDPEWAGWPATSPSGRSARGSFGSRALAALGIRGPARSRSCSGSVAWSTSTCISTSSPDGVFVDDQGGLAFVLHPVPRGADLLAIHDRLVRRVMRRLANEAVADLDESIDPEPDLFAQVQAEAATTWRAPAVGSAPVRGSERLRAWHEGFSSTRCRHAAVTPLPSWRSLGQSMQLAARSRFAVRLRAGRAMRCRIRASPREPRPRLPSVGRTLDSPSPSATSSSGSIVTRASPSSSRLTTWTTSRPCAPG